MKINMRGHFDITLKVNLNELLALRHGLVELARLHLESGKKDEAAAFQVMIEEINAVTIPKE